jgi:putative exosortase-associated protein (TIGR04073 family)
MDPGLAISKLGRGAVNTVTGWVEIPKRVQETSAESGAAAGFTWGLLRGLGYGIVRTAAGLYEIISFPFPAPPDYAPVMEPEYVFGEGAAGS